MKLFLSTLALGLAFLGTPNAHATDLALVVAGDNAGLKSNGNSVYDSQTSVGGGLLLEFRSNPTVGLEIGALYAPRKFSDREVTALNVPVMVRFHLSNWFSIGLGGFYDHYLGDFKIDGNDAGSYNGNGIANSDYGVMGSVGLRFPIGSSTHFIIDGRYLQGLKDQSFDGSDLKFHDIQVLAGFQFWL